MNDIKLANDGLTIEDATEGEEENQEENVSVPSSTRMCVFQLAESNDINRVTNILEYIIANKDSPESIQYMVSKYNLTSKLQMAFKKYCNGEYSFDQDVSKNGKF